MSDACRRAVRPQWICGAEGEGVEHGEDDWENYAKRLIAARGARAGGPEGEERARGPEGEGEEVRANEESEEENIDQQCGERKTKRMLDPKLPSQEEVRQHCLTHMPYRNWCPHCVTG